MILICEPVLTSMTLKRGMEMRFVTKVLSLSFVVILLAGCALIPGLADNNGYDLEKELPFDASITAGTLDNGLRYFIKQNGKPEQRAELRLAVNAGSILETEEQLGLAHLLEHMAFNGTEHFPKLDLVNYLESIGMRFGPDLNAYTSFDETVYMLQVPTDDTEKLEKGFQILEDWAHLMSLEGEEIDKERGVVTEEWRLGRGADMRMLDEQLPVLLKGSRYAERLPIGKMDVVQNASYETIRSFYRDWYRPDLMAIVAVGDFDPAQIEAYIQDYFGKIPNPENPPAREVYDVPEHEETLTSIASDEEATRWQVSVYYKHPSTPDRTLAEYRAQIIENLYNTMFNARLGELAQQADAPFLYGYSGSWSWTRTGMMYSLGALVAEQEVERGLEALLVEAERVHRYGFTQSELDRQKKEVMRGIERLYTERDKQESRSYANELVRHYLKEEAVPGIVQEYQYHRDFLPGISLEEVNDVARRLITEENRVITVNAPRKEGVALPVEQDLQAVFAKVGQMDIQPYEDVVSNAPLISELPPAGSVVERVERPELGVTEWTLSNGIRLILRPTDFKNDEIIFNAYSPGGTSVVPNEQLLSGRYASSIVGSSGLGDFDEIALAKRLAGQTVSVSPYISTLFEGLRGSASPQDLETLFQLIYLNFTSPRRDADAFSAYINRLNTQLQNRDLDPEAVFSDSISVVLNQHHPRRLPMTLEQVADVDLDEALAIYRERFADAGDFTFVFVGNFDLETMEGFATQYLATLPALDRNENWADEGIKTPRKRLEKNVYQGMEPKSYTRIAFAGDFNWNRQHRYDAYSMLSVLRIRLREVLREDMGGVYGVGAWISLDKYPREEYLSQITFGCSPDRVDELTEAVLAEIKALQAAPPAEEYLVKVRETQRNERELGLKENRYWLNALTSYYRDGRDLSKFMQFEELIEGLNGEAIQAAAKRHFDLDKMVQITLYPEEMASE